MFFRNIKSGSLKNYIKNIQNKTLDHLSQKKITSSLNDSVVQRSFVATGGTVLAITCNQYWAGVQYCEEVIMQVLMKGQALCF